MANQSETRETGETRPSGPHIVLIGGGSEGPAARLASVFPVARTIVQRVLTSRETLDRAAELQPDLVILDADLADAPGTEVCRALLAHHYVNITTPVLLATAAPATDAELFDAIRAGARGCVGPWTGDERVRRLVDSYGEAKQELERGLAECLVDPGTGMYNRRGMLRRVKELGAHATRGREALACIVVSLDGEQAMDQAATPAWGRRWSLEIQAASRVSDIIGRVETNQFAVIAPATDAAGAVRMARRLTEFMRAAARPSATLRLRAGYDAIANLAYSPIEPSTLLQRATAALRAGRPEPSAPWIRRFEAAPPTSGHAPH